MTYSRPIEPGRSSVRNNLLRGFVILACAANMAVAADTVRIRADDWMPMNGDPAAPKPGYVVEIVRAVFRTPAYAVDYQLMPWDDSLKAVTAGEIDAVIGASKVEGAKLVLPSEAVGVARMALWVRKDKVWEYRGVSSLEKIRLGAIAGYDYWDELDAYVKDRKPPQVFFFTGDTPLVAAIDKLREGEIDALPESMTVFVWNLRVRGLKPEDFRSIHVHEGDPFYVAFTPNPKGVRMAARFDEELRRLRENGQLAKILEPYRLADWK